MEFFPHITLYCPSQHHLPLFTDFPSLSSENLEYSMCHIHLWDSVVVQEEDSASSEGSCEAPDHALEIISCSFLKAMKDIGFLFELHVKILLRNISEY